MVTLRSPFCGHDTTQCVEAKVYRDIQIKIESLSLRKCPCDRQITNKTYLSDITVANISHSFTYKMAAKPTGIDVEGSYVTVTLSLEHVLFLDSHSIAFE